MIRPTVILLVIFFLWMTGNTQSPYPPCLDEMIAQTAAYNKKNPCEGTDKILRIEAYTYKDTLLYKPVFERKGLCLDYRISAAFYTADCRRRFYFPGGSLLMKGQANRPGPAEMGIIFVKNIELNGDADQPNIPGNILDLSINEQGKQLKKFLLGMDVENHWIAGSHIDWETGIADHPDAKAGNHTHCSAFVAAACKQSGIYILRPPEHGQLLLANAQYDWLQTEAARNEGWRSITGVNRLWVYGEAQKAANHGNIVVAIIKNQDDSKPGHAALIVPRDTDTASLSANGPSLIMAGTHNFNNISLKNGFKSHLISWPEDQIAFYVHPIRGY
jgi:2C-methyl-D-erythritol 2,4-cyclodiphosphate synthase